MRVALAALILLSACGNSNDDEDVDDPIVVDTSACLDDYGNTHTVDPSSCRTAGPRRIRCAMGGQFVELRCDE